MRYKKNRDKSSRDSYVYPLPQLFTSKRYMVRAYADTDPQAILRAYYNSHYVSKTVTLHADLSYTSWGLHSRAVLMAAMRYGGTENSIKEDSETHKISVNALTIAYSARLHHHMHHDRVWIALSQEDMPTAHVFAFGPYAKPKDLTKAESKLLRMFTNVLLDRTRIDTGQLIPKENVIRAAQLLGQAADSQYGEEMQRAAVRLLNNDIEVDIQQALHYMVPTDTSNDEDSGWGIYNLHADSEWGRMRVQKPYLSKRIVAQWAVRRAVHGHRYEGDVINALHRLPIDGKVFRNKPRWKGGSWLLDMSGSMRIMYEDVKQLVTTFPQGIGAGYYGDPISGDLIILARSGRAVSEAMMLDIMQTKGHMNVIDGPALDWLGQQPHPRFVVTDLQVTGKHDRAVRSLISNYAIQLQRYKVKVYPDIQSMIREQAD